MENTLITESNFSLFIGEIEKDLIVKDYMIEKWKKVIEKYPDRHKISKTALRLALKINAELDIEVFPSVIKTHSPYNNNQRHSKFMMLDKNCNKYFFEHNSTGYLLKRSNLELIEEDDKTWIVIK